MKTTTYSSVETKKLAEKILRDLKGGDILGLVGDLGSGKTVFVQGLGNALGLKAKIQSPTFILLKVYHLPKPWKKIKTLVHIDAYRLKNSDQLYDIGFLDYAKRKDALTVIEWIDRVTEIKKQPNYKELMFKFGKGENERIISYSKK